MSLTSGGFMTSLSVFLWGVTAGMALSLLVGASTVAFILWDIEKKK
jgi:hypothetical protein